MVWHTVLEKPQMDPKAQGSRAKAAWSSCIANNWVQKKKMEKQKHHSEEQCFFS